MKHVRARNFLILLGSNVVSKGAWFISLVLLVNYLKPEEFGVLAALWALGAVAAGFADLGVAQVLLRDGARDPGVVRSLAARTLVLQTGLSFVLFALLSVAALVWLPLSGLGVTRQEMVVTLSIATMLVDRFGALFTVFSQLSGDYRRISLYRSVYFLSLLVAFALTINAQVQLFRIVQLYFALTVVFVVVAGWLTWRALPRSTHAATESMVSLVRQGIWFMGNTGLSIAYGRVEVVLLGLFGFTALAGAYHVAYQVILLFFSISGIFFTVVYARLYAHQGHAQALREDFVDTVRWLSFYVWVTAPILVLHAESLARALGSAALLEHADTVRILSLMIFLLPAAAALDFLPTLELAKQRVYAETSGLGITAILAFILLLADAPSAVAGAAVLGYAATIGLAYYFSSAKHVMLLVDVVRETVGVAGAALIAMVSGFVLNLWQFALVYPLLFVTILVAFKHPIAMKIIDRLNATSKH